MDGTGTHAKWEYGYLQEMQLVALREAEIFALALQPLQEARKSGRVAVDHALLRELARCAQRVALIGVFRGGKPFRSGKGRYSAGSQQQREHTIDHIIFRDVVIENRHT
jgi:hypothetical protein